MLNLDKAFAVFPRLETERFLLRELQLTDADAIFRIMSDPLVMRYFGAPLMTVPEEGIRRVESAQRAFREQEGIRWAIVRQEDNQFLGSCGFWRIIKPHLRSEIGYELDRAVWGQGIMTEVGRAILGFGFETLGLHSIEAQIEPANTGSRRVLEKLGFVQEGYFRENYYDAAREEFTDTAVFSLLNPTP